MDSLLSRLVRHLYSESVPRSIHFYLFYFLETVWQTYIATDCNIYYLMIFLYRTLFIISSRLFIWTYVENMHRLLDKFLRCQNHQTPSNNLDILNNCVGWCILVWRVPDCESSKTEQEVIAIITSKSDSVGNTPACHFHFCSNHSRWMLFCKVDGPYIKKWRNGNDMEMLYFIVLHIL